MPLVDLLILIHRHYYRRSISNIDCNVVECDKKILLCALKTARSNDTSHCHDITNIEAYRHYYNHKNC